MGSKSSGGENQTTTQEPWKEAQPYLKQGMSEAQRLYNADAGYNPYQNQGVGQRLTTANKNLGFTVTEDNPYGIDPGVMGWGTITGVAGLTPEQQKANAQRAALAGAGTSGTVQQAQGAVGSQMDRGNTGGNTLQDTASGKYLDQTNPYLEGMYSAAARPLEQQFATRTLPALAAQFSGSGAQGSPDHQYWAGQAASGLTDQLGDMRAQMYGNAYSTERGLQQQAAGQLYGNQLDSAKLGTAIDESVFNRGVSQANLLDQAGQQQQGIAQQLINQNIGTYDAMQNKDLSQLDRYIAALNSNPAAGLASTSSPTAKTSSNPMMGAAGGAASGAAMGTMIAPGYGTAIGAVGGGLLGYFGS